MPRTNDFRKEPNIIVSASIGKELYQRARELQEQGIESCNWSNAMRRGLMLVIKIAEGSSEPEDAIKRLRLKIQELIKENESLREGK